MEVASKKLEVGAAIAIGGALLYWGEVRLWTPHAPNGPNPYLAAASLVAGAPSRLLKAVALWESDSFQWSGRTHPDGVSHGATGITFGTAQRLGYTGDEAALNSLWSSLRWGGAALAEVWHKSNGDVAQALTWYNHGPHHEGIDDVYVGHVLGRAKSAGLTVP